MPRDESRCERGFLCQRRSARSIWWVRVREIPGVAGIHLMPIYLKPDLLASVSPELKSRMQGKSCFNFSAVEPALFKELTALTKAGYASYKEQGLVP